MVLRILIVLLTATLLVASTVELTCIASERHPSAPRPVSAGPTTPELPVGHEIDVSQPSASPILTR